jgi:hypothetical protein
MSTHGYSIGTTLAICALLDRSRNSKELFFADLTKQRLGISNEKAHFLFDLHQEDLSKEGENGQDGE